MERKNDEKSVLGFTLAEVLITLSIIGIVASLTIPNMMANYQKHVYVTKLKKFYSVFQQGLKGYAASMGCSTMSCTGLFDNTNPDIADNFMKEIPKIFKVNKACAPVQDNCLAENVSTLNKEISSSMVLFYDYYTFRTLDGLVFDINPRTCNAYQVNDSKLKNACGFTTVDVNGNKKPNQLGRDVFVFYIGNDGVLYPEYGTEYVKASADGQYWKFLSADVKGCGTAGEKTFASNNRGYACTARIMEEGWEMNY